MSTPRLTVVLCTLDRPEQAVSLVVQLLTQLGPSDELLVVDQSAPEGFAALNAAVPVDTRLRIVTRPRRGLPAARNEGVEASRGELLLFLDDDVHLLPGCIDAMVAPFDDPHVGGVGGRVAERVHAANAAPGINRIGLGGRIRTNLWGERAGDVQTLAGRCMCLRRAALEQVGPFDVGLGGTALLEDADISLRIARAGWLLRFEPRAELVHLCAETGGVRVESLRASERWRFHNTARYVRRHRGWLGAPPLALTFSAIAARRALEWRRPGALTELLGALVKGWRGAESP